MSSDAKDHAVLDVEEQSPRSLYIVLIPKAIHAWHSPFSAKRKWAWTSLNFIVVVASPALTTIVDITGFLIYFSAAKLLLGI